MWVTTLISPEKSALGKKIQAHLNIQLAKGLDNIVLAGVLSRHSAQNWAEFFLFPSLSIEYARFRLEHVPIQSEDLFKSTRVDLSVNFGHSTCYTQRSVNYV